LAAGALTAAALAAGAFVSGALAAPQTPPTRTNVTSNTNPIFKHFIVLFLLLEKILIEQTTA
jgi:hypothetical protein